MALAVDDDQPVAVRHLVARLSRLASILLHAQMEAVLDQAINLRLLARQKQPAFRVRPKALRISLEHCRHQWDLQRSGRFAIHLIPFMHLFALEDRLVQHRDEHGNSLFHVPWNTAEGRRHVHLDARILVIQCRLESGRHLGGQRVDLGEDHRALATEVGSDLV